MVSIWAFTMSLGRVIWYIVPTRVVGIGHVYELSQILIWRVFFFLSCFVDTSILVLLVLLGSAFIWFEFCAPLVRRRTQTC